ncbi:MAG: hypothetical protein WBX01_07895 [Nitrososphaeraceae archaeon]|jgi:hypothetical protein
MNSKKMSIPIMAILGILLSASFFTSTAIYAQTDATTNTTSVGENELFQRGIATSVPIEGAYNEHATIILPPREDGALYEGTLTFAASRPVEIVLGHRMSIDNSTYSQIDPKVFGSLRIFDTTGAPDIPKIISAPSFILPDYGSSTPHFSASIPFVASAVVLGSLKEPFITAYEVSAQIAQPETVINIESANVNATGTNSTDSTGP